MRYPLPTSALRADFMGFVFAAFAVLGCSPSEPANGTVRCGPVPHQCPSGYYCEATSNTCWHLNTGPDAGRPDGTVAPSEAGGRSDVGLDGTAVDLASEAGSGTYDGSDLARGVDGPVDTSIGPDLGLPDAPADVSIGPDLAPPRTDASDVPGPGPSLDLASDLGALDTADGGPVDVPAATPATLQLSSPVGSSPDFGSLSTGASKDETFVVTNIGQQLSGALTVTVSGTDFSLLSPATGDCVSLPASNATTLAAGATCTVRVRFLPSAAVARTGTLTVSLATGSSDTLTLHGTGLAPSALTVVPSSLGFGAILVGGQSPVSSLTVSNTGGVATSPLATSLPTGEFAIANDGCKNLALQPGTSCTVSLTFNPTTASASAKTSSLVVSATTGGALSVGLSGSAVTLTIDQASFTFPTTAIYSTSATRSFSVSNPSIISAGTGTGLAVAFTGAAPTDYHVNSSTCTGSLGPSGICTVVVSFSPATFGMRNATMSVSATPGGSASAALSGQGQAADGQQGCVTNVDCQSNACVTYYPDADQDTYGDPGKPLNVCGYTAPSGYVTDASDCNDANPNLNRFTTICSSSTQRTYCLDDATLRTQNCTGGGCVDSVCVGTVGIAGTFTCSGSLTCTTAQGCSWTSTPVNPSGTAPACNLDNVGVNQVTCDDSSDCGAGQVCCLDSNCGTTHIQTCYTGSCPPSQICTSYYQLCNPLAPVCPNGTTCKRYNYDITTGQGTWACS